MFTMKKIAILAVAGFIASSVVACSDDDKGDDPVKPAPTPLGEGWDKSGSVELGGTSNATLGSFLDIDKYPFKVYTKGESADKKDEIDLIFDGSNFLTPEGCVSTNNALCGENMGGYDEELVAALLDVSSVSDIKASSTPNEVQDFVNAQTDAQLGALVKSAVEAKKNGKYLIITTEGNLALVIVNDDLSTASVTLSIGRIAIPEDEE